MYGTLTAARKIDSLPNSEMRLEKKMLVYSVAALLLPLAGEKRMAPIWSVEVSVVRSALRRIE